MEKEPDTEHVLHRLYDQVNEHIETRWEYFQLNFTEKLSHMAADLAGAITIFVFAVVLLFFFSMGFAWWLGDFIGHRAGGFALAGLVFIPIAYLVNRWIRPFVRDKIIQAMLDDDKTEKPTNHG